MPTAAQLVRSGIELQAKMEFDEALGLFEEALRLDPTCTAAHINIGCIYQARGHLEKAQHHYETAIELDPEISVTHSNLGAVFRRQGRFQDAIVSCRHALAIDQNHSAAYHNLGVTYLDLHRLDDAVGCFQRVAELNCDSYEAHYHLGKALRLQGNYAAAISSYQQAICIKPNCAKAYLGLGIAFTEDNRLDDAVESYQKALDLEPKFAVVHNNLGNVLTYKGNVDGAIVHFEQALKINPRLFRADLNLSELALQKLYQFSEQRVQFLKSILGEPSLTDGDDSDACFAIANVLHTQKRYDEAFGFYTRANDKLSSCLKRRTTIGYEPTRHRQFVDSLISTFDEEYFARIHDFGHKSDVPVFVVGMPRSGTTLVQRILSAHPYIYGAGELRQINRSAMDLPNLLDTSDTYPGAVQKADRETIRMLAKSYVEHVTDIGGDAKRVIDKMPGNFLHLGLIQTMLPNSRIIHCRRNPIDVCLSCYMHKFSSTVLDSLSANLDHLAEYYRQYERLMRHWKTVLAVPVLDIVYEEIVSDQETNSRKLVEFCELPWNECCLTYHRNQEQVLTASRLQVRQPIYSSAVERWKQYEPHLEMLKEALSESSLNNED